MPSTSSKQHRFMEAVAHDPGFAKRAGVPQSVGKDFAEADASERAPRFGSNSTSKFGGGIKKKTRTWGGA